MAPKINYGKCTGCNQCVEICPLDIIKCNENGPETAYPDECWHCGNCRISCPNDAISIIFPPEMLI